MITKLNIILKKVEGQKFAAEVDGRVKAVRLYDAKGEEMHEEGSALLSSINLGIKRLGGLFNKTFDL